MKVRWSTSSLRFRVTPTELDRLLRGEAIGVALALPGAGGWAVTMRPSAEPTGLAAGPEGITLALSSEDLARLADPSAEGVYFSTRSEPPLRYFVEKDFPCAHPHAEEACEEETERFAPTGRYLLRKHGAHAG